MKRRLLSTKVLSTAHQERLRIGGWDLTQYNAISIILQPVEEPPEDRIAIFSSQHAVRACLTGPQPVDLDGVCCLCVGAKSRTLLEERGIKVLQSADTAEALSEIIAKDYKDMKFMYYCGSRRLDTLPMALKTLGVDWKESVVYHTSLVSRRWYDDFDAVLFYSPSGVESFVTQNTLDNTLAYCIGRTTAAEARKYTERFLVATTPTLDALIALAAGQNNPVNR